MIFLINDLINLDYTRYENITRYLNFFQQASRYVVNSWGEYAIKASNFLFFIAEKPEGLLVKIDGVDVEISNKNSYIKLLNMF